MSGDTEATNHMQLATEIIATAQAMAAYGINTGTAGNVSARTGDGMLITPSGSDYSNLAPDDIVAMDFDGAWFATGGLRPSSEWQLHLAILDARSEVNAVVHCHSTFATALAVHGRGIPAFHYMVAVAGGADIRCAPYATFGSKELSDYALEALHDRKACLLAHHGVVSVGADLGSALRLAVEVEQLAHQYIAACELGEPPLLDSEQMAEVMAKMLAGPGYGFTRPPGNRRRDQQVISLRDEE